MNKQKLIALIIKKQTYKDTKPIQADILKKKEQAVTISISAITHILKDDYNAQAKLYAVRYLKDCFEKGNQSFIAKVESKILSLLVKMVKDSQSQKQIMKYGGSYTKTADLEKFKSVVTSLFTMSKECIQKWAAWIPDVDRSFIKAQKQVENIGVNPWKNGFSYFRQQAETIFRQNCQKNGIKLSNPEKMIKNQQLNSPIQKLQQQLPPQQPKVQSKLQINSILSANPKASQPQKFKYKSMGKMTQILKNSETRINNKQYINAKEIKEIQDKFNAAVNQYIQEASQFDEHYLESKIEDFQVIKKANQTNLGLKQKEKEKEKEKQKQRQQHIKQKQKQKQKQNLTKMQQKVEKLQPKQNVNKKQSLAQKQSKINPSQINQQKNSKQSQNQSRQSKKQPQQPVSKIAIKQQKIASNIVNNNNNNSNKNAGVVPNKTIIQQMLVEDESPTFKTLLDEKNVKNASINNKSQSKQFTPVSSVPQSAMNSILNKKQQSRDPAYVQPQIVLHSPKFKQTSIKNSQIAVQNKNKNVDINIKKNVKQAYIQQQQRVSFSQSDDEDVSQNQSRPLINAKANNMSSLNKNTSKQPTTSEKVTGKFIRQEQFNPNAQINDYQAYNKYQTAKPQKVQKQGAFTNMNMNNNYTNPGSNVNKNIKQPVDPKSQKLQTKSPFLSNMNLQQLAQNNAKQQYNANSNPNSLNNSQYSNSRVKIQQLTKQYQFQTEQLHKRIFALQKQMNILRQNEKHLKQGIKISQIGSNQIQFLRKRLQKEENDKIKMERQVNNLKGQLSKVKYQFQKSKDSLRSISQAIGQPLMQNNENNFSQRPSQISKSSYKVKRIKPSIIIQDQQTTPQNGEKLNANILPVSPVSGNTLTIRLDEDYVNNMTHYEKIGSWLSSQNILRFRLCILGVSQEFYKDQNILMYKVQNLFTQNKAQFLKITFMYHFKRLQCSPPKATYKNIAEVDFWTKPMTGQNQVFSQETICRLCMVPIKIMKSTITYNNNMSTTFLLPFLFYNFLKPIEFEAEQFRAIFSSRNHQTIKSKVIHLDSHIASTAVDLSNIFKHSKLNNQFLQLCLTEQAEQKVYMTQIQLLRNQKAVVRILTIPSSDEMLTKAKQLINNLVFLLATP